MDIWSLCLSTTGFELEWGKEERRGVCVIEIEGRREKKKHIRIKYEERKKICIGY